MQLIPMDVAAEIHRMVADDRLSSDRSREVVVARGPLVIMAHGLCAIEPGLRERCWITSPMGDLSADEAEEALRIWSTPVDGAPDAA